MTTNLPTPMGGRGDALPAPIEQLELAAKMLAASGAAVPPAFRGQPDLCKAIAWQAAEWGMSALAVAQKAYVVPGRKPGEERVAYEAQLIHALINERAPMKGRLKFEFEGEGATRRVVVSGTLEGNDQPSVYRSPTFGQIKVKNSPLWFSDQDQQFRYYGARNWARAFCPEVVLGIESPDEREVIEETITDVGPARATALFDDSEADMTDAHIEPIPADPLLEEGREAAIRGSAALVAWWERLTPEQRTLYAEVKDSELKPKAAEVDAQPDDEAA
ncbi:recombinase RecT [Brevundimonas balnearis]|uniref:Recombinase RecT n=1 Tax=Brevundimonas balnearis TaxID=1572858 RepID=A0ABV6R1A7_9CAUL